MYAAIPLAGIGLVIGLMFLLVAAVTVAAWCFLCFRVGLWLAGGCCVRTAGPASAPVLHRCAAPNPAAANQAAPPQAAPPQAAKGGCGRRHRRGDRPSSAVGMMLVLLLVCLAVFGLKTRAWHHTISVRTVSDKAIIQPADDAKHPSWSATGHGITKDDADEIAMKAAYASVLNYVERDMPPPHWLPSHDYVAKKLITSRTTVDLNQDGLDPDTKKTTLQVEFKPSEYRYILQRGRMLFLIKLVGALVLILAAIAIYLRLDDLGQGYCTGWLRLATAAAITAVIVGMLSLFGIFSGPADGHAWMDMNSLPALPLAAIGLVVFLSLRLAGRKG